MLIYSSTYAGMFPMPRVVYAMANDGLIFKFLGNVNCFIKEIF